MVRFDDMKSFDMWRCKLMDVLTSSNLKDALRLEEKPKETSEKDWDKMKRTACGVIRSFLTSYDD